MNVIELGNPPAEARRQKMNMWAAGVSMSLGLLWVVSAVSQERQFARERALQEAFVVAGVPEDRRAAIRDVLFNQGGDCRNGLQDAKDQAGCEAVKKTAGFQYEVASYGLEKD